MAELEKYKDHKKYPLAQRFDIVDHIDDTIKAFYGNSDGWNIFDSGMKIVITSNIGERYWFMYSRNNVTPEDVTSELSGWFNVRDKRQGMRNTIQDYLKNNSGNIGYEQYVDIMTILGISGGE